MRKSIIIAAIAITVGLVAGAQASDRDYSNDRRSSHIERHTDDRDGGERLRSRDHQRTVSCQVAAGNRLSADDLRTKLTLAGYQVWSLEPKRNGCIEAKVSQANGSLTELYVDPATAEIKASK